MNTEDLLKLHQVQDFVYGVKDIDKLERNIFEVKVPGVEDLQGRTDKTIRGKMNYLRDYMNDVRKIRQTVTDAYNTNQKAQYQNSKLEYIKSYYEAYGSNRDSSERLPQIDEYLDAELEEGDFK